MNIINVYHRPQVPPAQAVHAGAAAGAARARAGGGAGVAPGRVGRAQRLPRGALLQRRHRRTQALPRLPHGLGG